MFDLHVGKITDHFRSRWVNCKNDVRKAESGNMKNVKQKILQSHFLQCDHQGFLKDVEVRLTDKTQSSDPTSFTEWEYWELCLLRALILKVTIGSLFTLTNTFTAMFGSPELFEFCLFDCTILSASWVHDLIAQSYRASEWKSVVVGSNPTQANFL